ncbi:hypothetical protein [Bacillus mesophilum]|uniref:Uncharacterized protein n=1 Tax=Bacillus mesophilum TaxID=1071718 RepID=A0A7V7RLZ6_9BACI|nr:hypothetical protein [Bacillus mesophilum]KAB2332918.1 hypothetical protein F7732_12615 [Bacillus mesophilum]
MFKRKVETMSVKEFMSRKPRFETRFDEFAYERKIDASKMIVKACVTAGVIVLSLSFGDVSFAAANVIDGAITAKVVGVFEPVVELVKALSYPISLVMMLSGGLFVMIGNSERGFSMIQKAGLGYVLVQMLPMIMDLLVEIAKAL